MSNNRLLELIQDKKSFLCIGLDIDSSLISGLNPLDFCLSIIDTTYRYCPVYKINLAFFELSGLDVKFIVEYIHNLGSMVIIDGKRGDIGNSSEAYKQVMYDDWNSDGATLHPYMGYESLKPFLNTKDKFSIILGLTSNDSEIQRFRLESGLELWEEVINQSLLWDNESDLWFVMGANRLDEISKLRKRGIDNFFLIPGVGSQGGELDKVMKVCQKNQIINVSRSIIYSKDVIGVTRGLVNEMKKYV